MEKSLVMQGRSIGPAELEQVRGLLAARPDWSRYRLSCELCQVWNWRNQVGQIKDMAARSLLLKLEERGWVALPARRRLSPNRMRHKQIRRVPHPTDLIIGSLSQLRPLQIQELSQHPEAQPLFDWLLHHYHYLGYTSVVGQNVKYLVRGPAGTGFGLFIVWRGGLEDAGAGCLHWLDGGATPGATPSGGQQQPVFDFALGAGAGTGQPHFGPGGPTHRGGLAGALRPWGGAAGDVCGTGPVPGLLLSGGQLDLRGSDARAHPAGSPTRSASAGEGCVGLSPASRFSKGFVSLKLFTREELLPLARSHPEVLVDIILALQDRLAQLEQRVRELEAQVARNSSNSSKPPSSDGLSKPSPKSLRSPSGRKPGGQPGHPGQTLPRVQNPDHIEVHPLEVCPQCGGHGLGREPALDYESRQVFDLPELSLAVTEHRVEIKSCPHCGQTVGAGFPAGVRAPAQYGPRFQSLMVYLNQQQLLPYDRLAQMCQDLFGQPLSVATLAAANERAYHQLDPFAQALAGQVPLAEVVHLDESGLRVDGTLHWLHVASTATLTCYGVHPKRGTEAMDALGIVGACRQWVVHDHWKPYFSYEQCQHALCNEHLLRELKFLWEEQQEVWARQMSDLLLALHRRRQKHGEFNERQFKRAR